MPFREIVEHQDLNVPTSSPSIPPNAKCPKKNKKKNKTPTHPMTMPLKRLVKNCEGRLIMVNRVVRLVRVVVVGW